MVRSTQIDPNDIQLEDAIKDEGMGMQLMWEKPIITPHEAMERGATMAPYEKRKKLRWPNLLCTLNGTTFFAIPKE